jgi:hypothetical protein
MKGKDYHITLTVKGAPHEVFNDINSVTKWWNENLTGNSKKLNDEFTVRFGDVHVSTQKLIEFVPDKKVVWLVTQSKLNFISKQDEWTGTKISFELSEKDGKTQIDFTHFGLVPTVECFDACEKGWDYYLKGSLYKLLITGKGEPERKLS